MIQLDGNRLNIESEMIPKKKYARSGLGIVNVRNSKIGESAFSKCKLRSFYGKGVKIHDLAFWDCPNLKEIKLENIKYIAKNAFIDCPSIRNININGRQISLENSQKFRGIYTEKNMKTGKIEVKIIILSKGQETIYTINNSGNLDNMPNNFKVPNSDERSTTYRKT